MVYGETAALRREAERLLLEADRIDSEPEDDHEIGSIITWERTFERGDVCYTYAAIKYSSSNWATTGRTGRLVSWRSLWQQHLSHAIPGTVYWCSELVLEEWS